MLCLSQLDFRGDTVELFWFYCRLSECTKKYVPIFAKKCNKLGDVMKTKVMESERTAKLEQWAGAEAPAQLRK